MKKYTDHQINEKLSCLKVPQFWKIQKSIENNLKQLQKESNFDEKSCLQTPWNKAKWF